MKINNKKIILRRIDNEIKQQRGVIFAHTGKLAVMKNRLSKLIQIKNYIENSEKNTMNLRNIKRVLILRANTLQTFFKLKSIFLNQLQTK